ncbi:hypothetical protein GCM10017673_37530 [Streptosporangium violaceochromogenes]|nr:hypothetical protein GCM10017673_37530 [Streptosporangium violaceochromogenes]
MYRTTGRRLASCGVTVAALAALSLSLVAACSDDPDVPPVTADCVVRQPDGSYQAVDDKLCDTGSGSSFVWIYDGRHDSRTGRVSGGTFRRPPQTNITARSGRVVVGGFGGSARAGGGS